MTSEFSTMVFILGLITLSPDSRDALEECWSMYRFGFQLPLIRNRSEVEFIGRVSFTRIDSILGLLANYRL